MNKVTHTHQPGKGQKAFRAQIDSHIETEHALVQIPGSKLFQNQGFRAVHPTHLQGCIGRGAPPPKPPKSAHAIAAAHQPAANARCCKIKRWDNHRQGHNSHQLQSAQVCCCKMIQGGISTCRSTTATSCTIRARVRCCKMVRWDNHRQSQKQPPAALYVPRCAAAK